MIYMLEDDANIRNFVLYALNNSGLEAKGFERPSEFWAMNSGLVPCAGCQILYFSDYNLVGNIGTKSQQLADGRFQIFFLTVNSRTQHAPPSLVIEFERVPVRRNVDD